MNKILQIVCFFVFAVGASQLDAMQMKNPFAMLSFVSVVETRNVDSIREHIESVGVVEDEINEGLVVAVNNGWLPVVSLLIERGASKELFGVLFREQVISGNLDRADKLFRFAVDERMVTDLPREYPELNILFPFTQVVIVTDRIRGQNVVSVLVEGRKYFLGRRNSSGFCCYYKEREGFVLVNQEGKSNIGRGNTVYSLPGRYFPLFHYLFSKGVTIQFPEPIVRSPRSPRRGGGLRRNLRVNVPQQNPGEGSSGQHSAPMPKRGLPLYSPSMRTPLSPPGRTGSVPPGFEGYQQKSPLPRSKSYRGPSDLSPHAPTFVPEEDGDVDRMLEDAMNAYREEDWQE